MPGNRSRPPASVRVSAWAWLLGLLILPLSALSQLSPPLNGRVLMAGLAILSVATYAAYRSDKRRAEAGAWRIPETTLHFMALLGGWPGGFLAQRRFRHKTAKVSFQMVFWAMVLAHQLLAVDFLLGWRLTSTAWHFVRS